MQKRSLGLDRLGTIIGKVEGKRTFSAGHEELGVKSAMVLWKTDYLISTEWTFVKIFWNSPGSIYSCPDFFRLPGSDHYVFGA